MTRSQYRQFDNVDTAIAFLREVDHSVDWSHANWSLLDVMDSHPPSESSSV